MKLKIGITGQDGFVGKHLYNTLGLLPDLFERVEFKKDYFSQPEELVSFVQKCDVIVHLAAMNRDPDPEKIYNVNIDLVNRLISALKAANSKAHVIFSSSSQEMKDNLYGKSKKEGRTLLANWAQKNDGKFSGLIVPNVFGPFGVPNYNSFISTFCHKLTHQEEPQIDVDGDVKLIYVGELVAYIIQEIKGNQSNFSTVVPHTFECKVSSVLNTLKRFKEEYLDKGIIPKLNHSFELNLFNTFRSYIDLETINPVKYTKHIDERGAFVEIIRLNEGGQVSFSTTVPGIVRGNHFHTRKIERFSVIKGKALIQLRRIGTNKIFDFYLDGDQPSYVDMPIWYTHNIKNIGDEDLYTNFWINEFYDPNNPDTYFEEVEQ